MAELGSITIFGDLKVTGEIKAEGINPSGLAAAIAELNNSKVNNSQVLTNVPAGAKFTDTVYTHPNDANTRHVTDAQINSWNAAALGPRVVNATLTTSWTGAAAPFTQAVTISGVLAASKVLYDVNNASVTAAQMAAFVKGEIVIASKTTNSITFKALKDKPPVAIPITIIIL